MENVLVLSAVSLDKVVEVLFFTLKVKFKVLVSFDFLCMLVA